MPRDPDAAGASSAFSFTTFIVPANRAAVSATTGATIRHGPHQGAQTSTSTGSFESSTLRKESSVASTIHGSAAWQEAQAG